MTDTTLAPRRPETASRTATGQLARVEARRMLRHPAPWLGIALAAWWGRDALESTWASGHYEGLLAAFASILLGVSVAAVTAFARGRTPLAADAPLAQERRTVARLLGGLSLVGLVGVVVVVGAVWLRVTGGLRLGQEPGLTLHAQYSLPELLQPVLLAAFAVALGAAVVRVVRSQLASCVLLFAYWFFVGGAYWMFQGDVVRTITPLQVQPVSVDVGPTDTNPTTFPSDWLLSVPGEFQPHWVRLVVSPELAAWHDLYLVALTALLVAVVVPGRLRRWLLAGGVVVAGLAVAVQLVVAP